MTHDGDMDDFQADLAARLARAMEADEGRQTPPPTAADRCRVAPTPASKAATPSPAVTARTPPVAAVPRSGRREKTILLGLLGTLAGAFVGVLSLKLLVPRPPAGTGPDVHVDSVAGGGLDIVEPPALTSPPTPPPSLPDPFRTAGLPAAAPEALLEPPPEAHSSGFDDTAPPASSDRFPRSRFASGAPADEEPSAPPRFARVADDTGLTAAAPPDLQPVPDERHAAAVAPPRAEPPPGAPSNPLRRAPFPPIAPPTEPRGPAPNGFAAAPAGPAVLPASAEIPPGPGGGAETYVVREGDSWWSIAEGAYGDGRMYKALFAWNRRIDPRVTATPGTRIEVPRGEQLRAAWGRLVP